MKQFPRSVIYNLMIVFIFFAVYLFLSDQFISNDDTPVTTMDLLNLSITFQTSVGTPFVAPSTPLTKFIITLQQFLLIFGNLFILHL
jgi:hypothetical protein